MRHRARVTTLTRSKVAASAAFKNAESTLDAPLSRKVLCERMLVRRHPLARVLAQ
jgi:hypothetical protein